MGEGRSGWAEPVRDAVYLTGKECFLGSATVEESIY